MRPSEVLENLLPDGEVRPKGAAVTARKEDQELGKEELSLQRRNAKKTLGSRVQEKE